MFTYAFGVFVLFSFKQKKPDYIIVDSVHPVSGLVASFIKIFNSKIYFAFQIRDIWPYALVCDGAIKQRSLIRKFFTLCEFTSLSFADCIISSLPHYRNYLIDHWPCFTSLPIFYQPNPVDFNSLANSCVSKPFLEDSSRPLKFVYAGGFSNAHGVPQLINHIITLLDSEDIDVEFHFYGAGVTLNECKTLAKGNSKISFFDAVEKSKVASLISGYHVCIASLLPSKIYNYGLNLNKLYDYMKSSMPILLLCGPYNNCVQDSKCGIVVDPDSYSFFRDSIFSFASMSQCQLESMGQRGYQYSLKFYDIERLGLTYTEALHLSPEF